MSPRDEKQQRPKGREGKEPQGKKPSDEKQLPDDVIHDTGTKFSPQIPGDIDPDTHKPKRHAKKTRIKRRRNGNKEVIFPPSPTGYPLEHVPSGDGQIEGKPNVHVSAYVHTVEKPKPGDPSPEAPPNDPGFGNFYGSMVLFCVDGCPDATFYQFYNQSFTYSNRGETNWKSGWYYDTISAKPGKYEPLPDSPAAGVDPEPAMFDAPGQWGEPPYNIPPHAGDTLTRTDQFETFVCCDHKLVGFWVWEQTLTYTWGKTGGWGEPSVKPATPTWNPDPTSGGEPYDKLRKDRICSAK